MKRLIPLMLVLALLVLSFPAMGAEEVATCTTDADDGSKLPVCGTPDDNECYAGGTMAGKCESEWDWKGGWYMARFNAGDLSREQVPADWQMLLPPLPPPPPPVSSGGGGDPIVATPLQCLDYNTEAADGWYSCPAGCASNYDGIWGTDIYTNDSDICGAAIHAGVITDAGGTFYLTNQPGQDSYTGSTRNGITTYPWGSYGASFSFSN
jgi:hypothetical protein